MQSNTLLLISNLAVIASVWLLVAHEFSRSPSSAVNSYTGAPNLATVGNQKEFNKLEEELSTLTSYLKSKKSTEEDNKLEKELRILSKYFKTTRIELGRMKCEKKSKDGAADPVGDTGGFCMWGLNKFAGTGGNAAIDFPMAKAFEQFLAGKTVYDFGCGLGRYGGFWLHNEGVPASFPEDWRKENKEGTKLIKSWRGYDGSEGVENVTDGFVNFMDLTVPAWMEPAEWVVSLEVGEHIPKEFQNALLENLDRHNTEGIILSWAVRGQGGHFHVNNLDNHEVIALMENLGPGYTYDLQQSNLFKASATYVWFQNTVMVFRKNKK